MSRWVRFHRIFVFPLGFDILVVFYVMDPGGAGADREFANYEV